MTTRLLSSSPAPTLTPTTTFGNRAKRASGLQVTATTDANNGLRHLISHYRTAHICRTCSAACIAATELSCALGCATGCRVGGSGGNLPPVPSAGSAPSLLSPPVSLAMRRNSTYFLKPPLCASVCDSGGASRGAEAMAFSAASSAWQLRS